MLSPTSLPLSRHEFASVILKTSIHSKTNYVSKFSITSTFAPARNLASRHFRTDLRSKDSQAIGRVILVRHGQSIWNITDPSLNLTARFTGWTDIGLTNRGKDQAAAAARALKNNFRDTEGNPLPIDSAFCSLLSRSQNTMDLMLEELGLTVENNNDKNNDQSEKEYSYNIPVIASWRLNERHYGDLVGLSKEGAERLFGKDDLSKWRNSWSTRPPPMSWKRRSQWMRLPHCQMVTKIKYPSQMYETEMSSNHSIPATSNQSRIHHIFEKDLAPSSQTQMPLSESMSDTYNRIIPLWTLGIAPRLHQGQNVLVVAHANTIRSILHLIDPENVTRELMKKVKIPSAKPLVYTFREWRGGRQEGQKELAGRLVRLDRNGRDFVQKAEPDEHRMNETESQKLDGYWIENEIIHELSFCSNHGEEMGEQDIA